LCRARRGRPLSDFRRYEDWQVVFASQFEGAVAAILANLSVIDAYRAGIRDSALHSMIANKGGSHEGTDGHHIPRPIG
jgi:hypothetical protein